MKYANLRAFEKHLEGASPNHFGSLYGLLSKDDFLRQEALGILLQSLLKSVNNRETAKKTFDGEKFQGSAFFEELEGLSLFNDVKIIILNNADKLVKAQAERLEKYFGNQNPHTTLILTAPTLNRSTNFYKKAEKAGIFLDLLEEKPWEKEKSIQIWMQQYAAQSQKKLEPKAAEGIVKQVGADHGRVKMELDKLFCYVGDRPAITLSDVGALITSVNLETIWQLSEALFLRQAPAALRIGKALLGDGTAIIALLRQLRSQFLTEFQVCAILSSGGNAQQVAAEFPYMSGNILDRHLKQDQAFGLKSFQEALLLIDRTELEAKNSSTDPELLFERLAITICLRK